MKKNNALKPILFIVLGLVAGILIGMSINGLPPRDSDLAGSIGKVDNKRNVRITENDILLRNELAEDTAKLVQYQHYLSYIYYKSLKSSTDVERVISLTADNQEFLASLNLSQTLDDYLTYLNIARADLLKALHAVENPDMATETPIIQYLNDAQNAASRIYSNEEIFLTYMDGIENWLAKYPEKDNKNLKEAHDLLAFNVLQNALIAQDKPLLKYIEDKKMVSNNQSLYNVLNDTIQKNDIQAYMEIDNAGITNFNALSSQKILKNMEQMNMVASSLGSAISLLVLLNDAEAINSFEKLGTGFTDQQKINAINEQQALGAINDQQKLGAGFTDQQKLQAINDQQKLNSFLNQQSLQAIFNQQKLGATLGDNLTLGAIVFSMQALSNAVNDQQKLGAINNQESLGNFYYSQESLGSIMNDLQKINSEALGSISQYINSHAMGSASDYIN
ncbi:MAG: hypothetical protein KJ578_13060 [Bacteroidetes bacterium]|nr:hypothetical protein [Bacteroidota bacterium]MBU1579955.1 hypothetical protein [Bacteroidota bacterium]MBU2558699.1 hypothetical protein [Bacteroidota bacterium]